MKMRVTCEIIYRSTPPEPARSQKIADQTGLLFLIYSRARALRRRSRPPLQKAIPAKHRSSLRRPERNRGFLAALRTNGASLGSRRTSLPATARAKIRNPLRLAALAPFGFVPELLIVEKHLFPGGKNEVRPAVDALQHLVLKLH
jgi:hypothetical protein